MLRSGLSGSLDQGQQSTLQVRLIQRCFSYHPIDPFATKKPMKSKPYSQGQVADPRFWRSNPSIEPAGYQAFLSKGDKRAGFLGGPRFYRDWQSPQTPVRSGGVQAKVPKEAIVGGRGSIIISRALVEELGLKEGERFTVQKSRSGLALSKK